MTAHFPFGGRGQAPGRRQAARVRLALPAKVILITGHQPCQLDDLSQTGAQISMERLAPPIGGDVVLMVNGVEAFGTVVWRQGNSFGLCFDEPMPMDDVVKLRGLNDHFQTLQQQQVLRRAQDFVQGRKIF